ncbi:MAG: hypothetical protein HC836_23155 [Richelia sp. RM2_1_2]|nr:hypothetical protein [Richelia sp. RM2_1_2]
MPILVSPGVDVSVIDESFYASSGPGTIPMIFFATRENKPAPGDPNAYAPGSVKENANKLFLITSQRELIQTFGEPTFVVSSGTPVHGDERNEYGLHAAYQYLGIANRAYVMRADIDLGQLDPTPFEPTGSPVDGTYWLDLANTVWGIFRSNGANNVVSYNDWEVADEINMVEDLFQAEVALFGSTNVATLATSIMTANGTLDINGTEITLTGGDSLQDVIDAINTANIDNIEATVKYTAKGYAIKIVNVSAGDLDLASTDASIIKDLGLYELTADISDARPSVDLGSNADFAIVTLNNLNRFFEKRIPTDSNGIAIAGATAEWYHIGSNNWRETIPTTVVGTLTAPTIAGGEQLVVTLTTHGIPATLADGSVNPNGPKPSTVSTTINLGNGWTVNNVVSALQADVNLAPYYANGNLNFEQDISGALRVENLDGGELTMSGTGATVLGVVSSIKARTLTYSPHTTIPTNSRANDIWVKSTEPNAGADWIVKVYNDEIRQWITVDAPMFQNDSTASSFYGVNVGAGVLYVQYDVFADNTAIHKVKRWDGSTWSDLVYEASTPAPTTEAAEGTLWYNTEFKVDIMVGDGQRWQGLHNHPWYQKVDIILSGSKPTQKPAGSPGSIANGGSTALVENDIWVDTTELESYPKMYRYKVATKKFELIDNTDQTTPFGVVFADARWTTEDGSDDAESFLTSNFVDPDAPNPLTYPNGMLLFNMRFSTLNVKEWKPGYLEDFTEAGLLGNDINPPEYTVGSAIFSPIADDNTGRWVTASGNQTNGAPWMARRAQRAMVVRALQESIAGNEDIRAESVFFNLIAVPGYTELLDEMVTLNFDKKLIAFIVGDTPSRLSPKGTSIQNWATNAANSPTNGDEGLLTSDTYVGLYYPWGLSTNVDGFEVMIPPSTIALRTMAYNDSVSYPWFAPAGFNRGIVSNAQSVGYLTSEGEFQPVILNQGQRDTIYINNINPIAFMVGQGLVIWGQKSRHPVSSALDRINVVRLINYLRYNFDILAKPYLFEPNDQQTRDSVKLTFERFLGDLITLRGLYDFAVVCDESNNTPARIDRNELWIDVAIQPVKAIEFIYIPIRVLNTGEQLPS